MRPNIKGGKNAPVSLFSHALTSYPTVRTIEASEEPSRSGKLLNSPQDRSRWRVPPYGKFSYRRKHFCYPFLDDRLQRIRDRSQTVPTVNAAFCWK
jgi:hypothetical protein